jgi:hypothetical protein
MGDFYGDFNDHDNNNQEEMWDDGFDDDQDSPQDHQDPPQEPRKTFKMPWQVVLSLQTLPGGRVQASTRHWPKDMVDSASRYDADSHRTIPCPHCKFLCSPWDLAEETYYHRRCFIEDNLKRAEEMAAELKQPPRKQRGRRGRQMKQTSARVGDEQELDEVARAMALTSFISFCDTRPAEEDQVKTRRRPKNKKAKTATPTETEKTKQTTKQSDHWDPAECQGSFKNRNPPTPAEQSPGQHTLDAAPEDNASSTTTTADLPHLRAH